MLVSLNSYNLNTPHARLLRNDAPNPAPSPEQPQAPVQDKKASIYFTSNDEKGDNGDSLRKAFMYLAMAGTLLTAACSKDDDAYAEAIANAYAEANANATANPNVNDSTVNDSTNHHKRDTVYIQIPGDTVVIDTGSYIHDTITITKWKDRFVRPIPLDSIMNDLDKFDVDSTSYPGDSTTNRNIIHYEATREWEYNNKEIGDINMPESSKNILVYNTDIRDYLDKHLYFGKTVYRIPTSSFIVETQDGRRLNSPKGYFVETYTNPTDNKNASIYDCELKSRAFVQTDGDTVKVYTYNKGKFIEDGKAAKGYLGANTILLRDLIGEYDTDEHLSNVKITAVDDEKLQLLYLRQMDEADEQTTRAYMANARKY